MRRRKSPEKRQNNIVCLNVCELMFTLMTSLLSIHSSASTDRFPRLIFKSLLSGSLEIVVVSSRLISYDKIHVKFTNWKLKTLTRVILLGRNKGKETETKYGLCVHEVSMRDTALCQGYSITYITLHAWGESK